MASSINASTTGAGGVITTADNSGILNLQSGGVTLMTLATNNTVTISGTTSQTGNASFTPGTYGIIFNNSSAKANSTFNDYETGTWTPTVTSTTGSITTVGSTFGFYTKIGNLVSVVMELPITNNGTGGGALVVTNLPFTMNNTIASYGSGREQNVTGWGLFGYISGSNNYLYIQKYDGNYPAATGYAIGFSIVYRATF